MPPPVKVVEPHLHASSHEPPCRPRRKSPLGEMRSSGVRALHSTAQITNAPSGNNTVMQSANGQQKGPCKVRGPFRRSPLVIIGVFELWHGFELFFRAAHNRMVRHPILGVRCVACRGRQAEARPRPGSWGLLKAGTVQAVSGETARYHNANVPVRSQHTFGVCRRQRNCAANYAQLVSTRTSSANKAKGIVVGAINAP
jgi:hypothetical protein